MTLPVSSVGIVSLTTFGGSIVNLPVGNTEVVMKTIAQLTGGTLFKIDLVKKYSSDYKVCTEEAQKDLQSNARPELAEYLQNIDEYNTIILGYPNYWGTMPMSVCTFLEHYDFSGKTILPLCTHEGSGMGHSESDIRRTCPQAKVISGLSIQGYKVKDNQKEISIWLQNAGVLTK